MPYGGTINATVSADLVQADVDGIVQGLAGSGGKTLSDVREGLDVGLLDMGMYPYLQMLQMDLNYYLYSQWSYMPWLEMIRMDLEYYLYNWNWNYEPWLQTVDRSINDNFYYMLYDQNVYQPWLQTIDNDLNNNLYDWVNGRPLLESVRDALSAVRAVLEDVHDAAQHALRTV